MNWTREKELFLNLSAAESWIKLDEPGEARPIGMALVDFVIVERERIIMVEVKDPSDQGAPERERHSFVRRLSGDEYLAGRLIPKARDSYCYLHLMGLDEKPILFVLLLGLERTPVEAAQLLATKERILSKLRWESDRPWSHPYVKDCAVVTVDGWRRYLPKYPIKRCAPRER